MLYDSHAHINHDTYTEEEREAVIKAIEECEELALVNDIGYDLASSKAAAAHAAEYPWCYAAVGIHPHDAKSADDAVLDEIKDLAGRDGVQAIGEIGLDFHYDFSPRDEQREVFRKQIMLANELGMPIVIHSREADQETMDILKEEGAFSEERKAKFPQRPVLEGWEKAAGDARVLLHCFSGSAELAEQYVKLGGWISLAGPVTFKNNKKTIRVAQAVPAKFLMVETDSPFLTPEPFRGRPNMSPYVAHTARRIGVLKQMDYEEICMVTMENGKRFFGIE